ncbi:hypothetical protein AC578_5056 [Pseudocercospora eumusae]|uniref:BTB domain-containing protein n=1 Tax=Pseudocercospora eumusae TaxID=321146 RepID=A0A139HIA9_9PEZI|nr:hypothetical protein AC578_5056 [Pseudocercospora eumusae]KXT02219.1 hypothetical protein AC578_5056 [Pseudocercospora eumusae]
MEALTKFASTFHEDQVITVILEDGGCFNVQKAVLHNASSFFVEILDREDINQLEIRCPTGAFELFLYWLCNLKLPALSKHLEECHVDDFDEMNDDIQVRLVQLWVCAGSWLMTSLQNAAMRALLKVLEGRYVVLAAVKTAFELSAPDSPIVSVMLREFVHQCEDSEDFLNSTEMEELGKLPGFLAAFIGKVLSHKGNQPLASSVNSEDEQMFMV